MGVSKGTSERGYDAFAAKMPNVGGHDNTLAAPALLRVDGELGAGSEMSQHSRWRQSHILFPQLQF